MKSFTVFEDLCTIATKLHDRKPPRYLFWGLVINLMLAPAVYAASSGTISREQSYALGLLGLVTLALSIYLFAVIFQPEKF
jgi:K+-transporting ATPase KdpF subunit